MILAAGALQLPQLLELSGIGSKDLLQTHSIDVVINNAYVVKNLQDHLLASLSFGVADDIPTGDVFRDSKLVKAATNTTLHKPDL